MAWCYYNFSIIPYGTYKVIAVDCGNGYERESGENPERSGHCDRGVRFHKPLCHRYEKGKPSDDSEVRKPALYGEVKLPCKV